MGFFHMEYPMIWNVCYIDAYEFFVVSLFSFFFSFCSFFFLNIHSSADRAMVLDDFVFFSLLKEKLPSSLIPTLEPFTI